MIMTKKQMIAYTKFVKRMGEAMKSKEIVKLFLEHNPNFFDEPEPIIINSNPFHGFHETFKKEEQKDETRTSFGGPIRKTQVDEPDLIKEPEQKTKDNHSQTGAYLITYEYIKL